MVTKKKGKGNIKASTLGNKPIEVKDYSPEKAFESVKELYQLNDPQLIIDKIMWGWISWLCYQKLDEQGKKMLQSYSNNFNLCNHVIEYRNRRKSKHVTSNNEASIKNI